MKRTSAGWKFLTTRRGIDTLRRPAVVDDLVDHFSDQMIMSAQGTVTGTGLRVHVKTWGNRDEIARPTEFNIHVNVSLRIRSGRIT